MLQSEQALWAICGAFYLSDLVRLPSRNRLLVEERRRAYWALVPLYRFLILGRAFTVLNPFTPWRTTFVLSWLNTAPRHSATERRAIREARVLTGRLSSIQWISALVLLSTLVMGPVVTESKGLVAALLAVVPIVVALWFVLAIVLFRHRRRFGFSRLRVAGVLAECALCPGYFANVWRRLCLGSSLVNADAVSFCAATMTRSQLEVMCRSLGAYLEDKLESDAVMAPDLEVALAYQAFFEANSRLDGR